MGDLSPSTVHPASRLRVINSSDLYRRCLDQLAKAEQAKLWGLHVQRGAVTLVIGTTSAGKTTFLHNLAFHMATGKEFLGIEVPRPLRVLYVDFESHDGVLVDHLGTIGTHSNLDFLEPEDLIRGQPLITALTDLVRRVGYDLVIVDPLMDAYPVEDENDNAEAMAQMVAFRELARTTKAGIAIVHNSGRRAEESADDSAFLGRGATARADKADVGINFVRDRTKSDPATYRALIVSKSRQANHGERIEFRFAGNNLGYELVAATDSESNGLGERIVAVVTDQDTQGHREVRRETIREGVGLSTNERDKKTLTRALERLVSGSRLGRPREGIYTLPPRSTNGVSDA